MEDWFKMTPQERINEEGIEPDCPFCHKPRVSRSDYIRCNRCGVNWLDEERHLPNYLDVDPRVPRRAAALMANVTKPNANSSKEAAEDFMVPRL